MARVSIEDCLDTVENRFALVAVAVDRTRSLMDGATPLIKSRNKEAVTALREIADGLIAVKSNRKIPVEAPVAAVPAPVQATAPASMPTIPPAAEGT